MIQKLDKSAGNVAGYQLSGTLSDQDYQTFVPEVETLMQQEGKVRILAVLEDFHGWHTKAAWDDMSFGLHHTKDIERMALVGDKRWEKWMAKLAAPFMQADVKYFDLADVDAAWSWIGSTN